MKLHTIWGDKSENYVGFNFWPLFVTKNGILRFSAFGLIKWSWIKNSKWNYPKFRGCGSENFIRLNFWPLFVTRNCILRFSAFGWTKWSWLKNSKINETDHNIGVHDSENLVGLNYWPLFVIKYYFCVFQLLTWWSGHESKKAIETIYNLAIADIESCVIEFLSPLYDLKQYFKLLAFYRTLFTNNVNSLVFVVLLGSVPFVFYCKRWYS